MTKSTKTKTALPVGMISTVEFAKLADVAPLTVTSWYARHQLPLKPAHEHPRYWLGSEVKAWIKGGMRRAI